MHRQLALTAFDVKRTKDRKVSGKNPEESREPAADQIVSVPAEQLSDVVWKYFADQIRETLIEVQQMVETVKRNNKLSQ